MAQERLIEKRGLVVFTDEERAQLRLELVCAVVVNPNSHYHTEKTNPPRGFYGFATVFSGDYVVAEVQMLFRTQTIWEYTNVLPQINASVACAIRSINQSLIALSLIIPSVGTLVEVEPTPLLLPAIPITAVKFVIPDGEKIVVRLSSEPYSYCNPSDILLNISEPELAPSLLEDPSTFIPTPPYDPTTSDDGDTYSPFGAAGATGSWNVTFLQNDCFGQPFPPYETSVPGYENDSPFLTTQIPVGSVGGSGNCCGVPSPFTYLVSSWNGRNMLSGGGNFNQDCNVVSFDAVFVQN